ncbi:MAG: efflux RND transporter permease subunit [Bacteroidales bacterium]
MDFILKRKVLISMLFIGLSVLGYVSYKKLAVELLPNAEFPTLIVQVGSPLEVDPSYIENQAIIPIEGAIGTLEDVEKIESNITSRFGTIFIYYVKNADLKYANLKLQEKIDLIRSSIPQEFFVNVIKIDLEQLTNQFMALQVRGEGGVDRIRNITEREIKPELENIDGLAGVQVYGGQENAIEIRLNRRACKSLGITMNQISSLLNNNSREKTFAGKVIDGSREMYVNVTSSYTDVRDLGNIIVKHDGPVLLRDIAEIFYGVKEQSTISRVNGLDEITINLVNDRQANLIGLSHTTLEEIQRLNRELAASGVEISVQYNSAETMEKNINQIISLTLVDIALAIGMLVDNSVVVLENIYRLAGAGKDPETSVKQGLRKVIRAVFASTVTTIIVFLPFLFTSNFLIKLIGKNISVSIISTLMVSLAVALLVIPMATFYLLSGPSSGNSEVFKRLSIHDRLIQAYHLVLKASMRKPAATIIGTLALFFTALLVSFGLSLNSGMKWKPQNSG